jgi:hypothetical protein
MNGIEIFYMASTKGTVNETRHKQNEIAKKLCLAHA